jgi:lipoprotein-anchoring transpeptidase ErfK/SrfK
VIATFWAVSLSCVPAENVNRPASNIAPPPANTNVNSNVAVAPEKPIAVSQVQVTLPLVDAILNDESYISDLKSSLQMSDDQIQKLRDAARDDVITLDESDRGGPRSTRAAVKKAQDKINQILGDEKTAQFMDFIRERASGVNPETAMAPNSVPDDTRIVINAPAFRMDEFQNGKLIKTYKVGIGYPEFPLATGLRKAEEIIFNPTWTPPDSPWVRGKFSPGEKVSAGSKDNPLGILKIPVGYPTLIHGGKQPSRLGNFASHGCVGLTNDLVRQFALEIADLSGTPLTLDQIRQHEKEKTETKDVKLQNPVPVELRYETIVVQNGKLMIYRDVYEKGTNTEETLRRVLDAAGVPFDSFSPQDQLKMLAAVQSMAVDAMGHPVDENDDRKPVNKTNIHETKNVKGSKVITLEFPQLAGKGYPDPVNMAG